MALYKGNNKAKENNEFKYEVVQDCGLISTDSKGRETRLRLISWNDREPKYDIRTWWEDENGEEKCGKGISLTGEQVEKLYVIIGQLMSE